MSVVIVRTTSSSEIDYFESVHRCFLSPTRDKQEDLEIEYCLDMGIEEFSRRMSDEEIDRFCDWLIVKKHYWEIEPDFIDLGV